MTVIVMIFLMAMVILLMRNMELMAQLRNTMEAERQAAELARTTGEEKESLALRLIETENELSMLRMQLMQMSEQADRQSSTIAVQRQTLHEISNQRDRFNAQLQTMSRNNRQLVAELESVNTQNDQLQRVLDETEASLAALRVQYDEQTSTLATRISESEAQRLRLSALEGDYSSLKVKYDKLVRPARTPAGKYVVEVRYARIGGKDKIEYKLPGAATFTSISRAQLDKTFSQLKKQHAKKLYIKVIFPKDSGLSYNEAWAFTSHLHKNFDYYFQEGEPGSPDETPAAETPAANDE